MTRRLVVLGSTLLVAVAAVPGTTQAAHTVAFPTIATACTPLPPVVLSTGGAPRAPLRLDLVKTASHAGALLDTERVHAIVIGPDGVATTPSDTTQVYRIAFSVGRPAHGRLPVSERMTMPGSSSQQAAALRRLRTTGYVDELNGGRTRTGLASNAASVRDDGPQTDHLPAQALGVGATWRVVNCDALDSTPARETRTYTLESVAHGVVLASYRDVVSLDPAHVDLGTIKLATGTAHFKLLRLDGTATGTFRLPLTNGFAQRNSTTTRVREVFAATSDTAKTVQIHTSFVSHETIAPTG
jgi:hypothetical protein